MPVGRVQSLYLKPLSFKEFLSAMDYLDLREFLEHVDLSTPIPEPVHQTLLKLIRQYMILGGMPSVLHAYLSSASSVGHPPMYDLAEPQLQQTILLNTYRHDFSKYTKHTQIQYVRRVFEKAPGLVGSHVKYARVDPDARSQNIKSALERLEQAGLIHPIYSTAASGLPLITLINEKKFKILFLDVGLMTCTSHLAAELLLNNNLLLLNRGAMAEQFVGQELLAYTPAIDVPHLYFWCREKKSSMAEVDFITTCDAKIIPIEVKAGTTGQLKSLQLFMHEKMIPLGVRIAEHPLSFDGTLLSIPLYMVSELSRLVLNIVK